MKRKKSIVAIKRTKDDSALMSMGVPGFGSIKLAGTNAFVKEASTMVGGVLDLLWKKHIDSRVAKGETVEQIKADLDAAKTKAAKKAGIKP